MRISATARTSRLIQLLFLILLAISIPAIGSAQVVYDWSSNSKTPESYPTITKKQNVTFTITNVNDILYSYRLEVTETAVDSNDFGHIADILKGFSGLGAGAQSQGVAPNCSISQEDVVAAYQAAMTAINEDPKLPVGYAKSSPHTSIPLNDSIAAWRSHADLLGDAVKLEGKFLAQEDCTLSPEAKTILDDINKTVLAIDTRVRGPHVFVAHHILSPGNNVSVTVFELLEQEDISSKTFTFPGRDILTLSAGALFSRIPDRTYEGRKSPSSTENILTVEGNSRATPSLLALLNYSLEGIGLDRDNAGLALSAGPVIRLGGKSDASAFGFFTGVSAHLARRFYITPGIHFGQFSDFPVGFGNGSAVPANFGELTPVKRWTARFGLGITFKTKDFTGLVSSEEPAVKGSNAGTTPTKPKDPPGDENAIGKALATRTSTNMVRREASARSEDRRDAAPRRRPAARPREETEPPPSDFPDDRNASGSNLRIAALRSSMGPDDDRISIIANNSVRNYATYFRGSRFNFLIRRAQIEVIQDELRGNLFRDPIIEKRGDDFVLSFELAPGARVSIVDRPEGVELILFRGR